MTPSNESPKIVIVLGKSGSGKGTQVDFLQKQYGFDVISSGSLLRNKIKEGDFVGKRIDEVLAKGELVPTPIVFHLWLHRFEELRERGAKGIIFEGSPRKVYEARLLEEVFPFYKWEMKPRVLYIHISDEEALGRLLKRGRSDDTEHAVRERLRWFQNEVVPVVDYYRSLRILTEINGEQSIEAVHQEILEKCKDLF